MSFLKITDPKKRDFIVDQFLKTKQNIQKNYLSERVGELNLQRELSKVFKPITDTQQKLQETIVSEIKPIKQSITKAVTFPQFSSIKAYDDSEVEEEREGVIRIGKIVAEYLRQFANKSDVDKTFGLYDKNGEFYIGDARVDVIEDNIKVGQKVYEGTPGLWELIISKEPSANIYTEDDLENYAEILVKTNSLKRNNDPNEIRPKSSKSWKWNQLLKSIWEKRDRYEGKGVNTGKVIIIPGDPNALVERLDILMASKAAGNTGVRNEIVTICDELLRQNVINKQAYKNIISQV